jgi:hypothetical protein
VVAHLRKEWTGLPQWARWVLAAYLIGFADGTAAHVRALALGGIHAYSAFSQVPVQVFFVCLVVLDPLVVVLAGFVLRAGIWLAAAVMTLDMAANWIGNWPWPHAGAARLQHAEGGLLLITSFGLFVLLSARPMLRVMRD